MLKLPKWKVVTIAIIHQQLIWIQKILGNFFQQYFTMDNVSHFCTFFYDIGLHDLRENAMRLVEDYVYYFSAV